MIYSQLKYDSCRLQYGKYENLSTPDFVDGQDEKGGAGMICQSSSDFNDIKCLPRRLACDGKDDCFDKKDERVGCNVDDGKTLFFGMVQGHNMF